MGGEVNILFVASIPEEVKELKSTIPFSPLQAFRDGKKFSFSLNRVDEGFNIRIKAYSNQLIEMYYYQT